MIASCPSCAARYRIDTAKLRPEGARLRCSRCETVFRVHPEAESAVAAPAPIRPVAAPTRVAAPAPQRSSARAARSATTEPAGDPEKRVLIAHPEVESGKAVADALASWGLSPLLVH